MGIGSPRWVLYGTPTSGACVIGCSETGVSVVALCEDVHYQKHLDIVLHESIEVAASAAQGSSRMRRWKREHSRPFISLCTQLGTKRAFSSLEIWVATGQVEKTDHQKHSSSDFKACVKSVVI